MQLCARLFMLPTSDISNSLSYSDDDDIPVIQLSVKQEKGGSSDQECGSSDQECGRSEEKDGSSEEKDGSSDRDCESSEEKGGSSNQECGRSEEKGGSSDQDVGMNFSYSKKRFYFVCSPPKGARLTRRDIPTLPLQILQRGVHYPDEEMRDAFSGSVVPCDRRGRYCYIERSYYGDNGWPDVLQSFNRVRTIPVWDPEQSEKASLMHEELKAAWKERNENAQLFYHDRMISLPFELDSNSVEGHGVLFPELQQTEEFYKKKRHDKLVLSEAVAMSREIAAKERELENLKVARKRKLDTLQL